MAHEEDRTQPLAPESPELEAERKAMRECLQKGEDSHWQVGVHYNNIVDKQLWKHSYHSARDFFTARFGDESQSTLTRCGAVARSFPQDVTRRYGVTLLAALLTYEKLAHVNATNGDPGNTEIQVPNDSEIVTKPFRDCQRVQLEAAIRHLRKTPDAVPTEDAEILQRLHEMIGSNGTIALSSRHGREGTIAVFAVPVRAISLLSQVLAQFCRPPPPPETAENLSPELMQKLAEDFSAGMKEWVESLGKAMPPMDTGSPKPSAK
jgi:hypothetical protein